VDREDPGIFDHEDPGIFDHEDPGNLDDGAPGISDREDRSNEGGRTRLPVALMDGGLAMARLSALQDRYDEAGDRFSRARTVLDEQRSPATTHDRRHDEALMEARRGEPGDAARTRPLLEAASAPALWGAADRLSLRPATNV
jgi:hypothetical protein